MPLATRDHGWLPFLTAIGAVLALSALIGGIGADTRWLAAIGHTIATRTAIPHGVPFATDPTGGWSNPVVLAELILAAFQRALGDRGLMLAQLIAVGGAFALMAGDARAGGATVQGTVRALLLVALGSISSLALARAQMFSLLLFPALVLLLHRAERERSARPLWLAVALLALWSNLHGGVLLGMLVMLGYLAVARARREPWLAGAVGLASVAAVCANPALLGTLSYYHGVLTNLAAQRGQGMWGALSSSAPLDVLLVTCALVLALRLRRARPQPWELAVAAGIALLSVQAARNGMFLLLFLAPISARAPSPHRTLKGGARRVLVPVAALASAALLCVALVRGPVAYSGSSQVIRQALALAHGSPLLADGGMDEQVALAGGRIAVGEPIDAFAHTDQAAYLDFLQGSPSGRLALTPAVKVVLVQRGDRAQALMRSTPGFSEVGGDRRTAIYERRPDVVVAALR